MKKDKVLNRVLITIVVVLMATIFYLTQKSYNHLNQCNQVVMDTNKLISGYQNVANDFKNALIYISTYKNSPSQDFVHTYGRGLWELEFHVLQLKRLVDKKERLNLDAFSKKMKIEEDWLYSANPNDTETYDDREHHIKSIVTIQQFFDNKISGLQNQALVNIKTSEKSSSRLNIWIDVLIISSLLTMLLLLIQVYQQLTKVRNKNTQLEKIAWINSHRVRDQVANILGLGQLINMDDLTDTDNCVVIKKIIDTSVKLDKIVRDINNNAL